jgi:3-methyl-2-oxobutanoate hydroxymethyltransferase
MSEQRSSVPEVRATKRRRGDAPLAMMTAYDEPTARLLDAAGVDLLLVGDSVANVVLGHDDTLRVGVEVMAHHTAAVAAARPTALIVGDLPWMSYHLTPVQAVESAATLVRAGAEAVKLEGGANRLPAVAAILDAEIPVMGHLGLTPQSVRAMGGFKVQGRSVAAADAIRRDAELLEEAGCFAIVLEGVPDALGEAITATLEIPTIGIGAGPATDGQVLVFHDAMGLSGRHVPKFVRQYAALGDAVTAAAAAYVADVRAGAFPSAAESYGSSEELREHLDGA